MNISYGFLKNLAAAWLEAGGKARVDFAALEPTLWNDAGYNIINAIEIFTQLGYELNLTTNGSTLEKYARDLALASVSKIRVSWHTLNPDLFKTITGGVLPF